MSRRDEQALNVHSVYDTDSRMETSGWAVAIRVFGPMSGHEIVGILCSSWHSCFPVFSGCMILHGDFKRLLDRVKLTRLVWVMIMAPVLSKHDFVLWQLTLSRFDRNKF